MSGSRPERVVIVGASLAGLRGAEALRREGFTGSLTIVGDEPDEPYDRPPLSKVALTDWVPPEHTGLPRLAGLGEVDWRWGWPLSLWIVMPGRWCWPMAPDFRMTGC